MSRLLVLTLLVCAHTSLWCRGEGQTCVQVNVCAWFHWVALRQVRGEGQTYTAAVSAGVSVRLWRGEQGGLLWHGQTRSEPVFAGLGTAERAIAGDEATVLRFTLAAKDQHDERTKR